MLRPVIDFARSLPTRLGDIEASVMRLLTITGDIRRSVQEQPPPATTYVYVLPPNAGEPTPMAAKGESVPRGEKRHLVFQPQVELPAGLWIVAVGPARVRSVRVGNQAQDAISDYNGHICQTRAPLPLGVNLTVVLEG